jgi:hypothetical protein
MQFCNLCCKAPGTNKKFNMPELYTPIVLYSYIIGRAQLKNTVVSSQKKKNTVVAYYSIQFPFQKSLANSVCMDVLFKRSKTCYLKEASKRASYDFPQITGSLSN